MSCRKHRIHLHNLQNSMMRSFPHYVQVAVTIRNIVPVFVVRRFNVFRSKLFK